MQVVSNTRRVVAPLALAVALLVLGAGSAQAALLPDDGANCNDYSYSQVFLPWADPANYTLAPGGNFENNGSHWTLDRGFARHERATSLGGRRRESTIRR